MPEAPLLCFNSLSCHLPGLPLSIAFACVMSVLQGRFKGLPNAFEPIVYECPIVNTYGALVSERSIVD